MDRLPHLGSPPSIQELLAGVRFPISKDQLIDEFQQNGATETILGILRNADKSQFTSADDVMTTLRNR